MDTRTLHYFIMVYEELSLSAAAKRCGISQPSISSAVQQLEAELERQLFSRHSRGVSPTNSGKLLYPYAVKVLNDIKTIKHLFRQKTLSLPFKIGLMPFLSGERIGKFIKELLHSIEGLDLTVGDWNEESDARIISSSMVARDEHFYKLWQDEYVLALPKQHPLTVNNTIKLKQIDGLPFISRTFCDAIESWNLAIQKQGIKINTKAVVSNEEYALDMVSAGLGISLVPSHSIASHPDIIIRNISDVKLERIIGLVCKNDQPLPFQLLTIVDNFRAQIESSN